MTVKITQVLPSTATPKLPTPNPAEESAAKLPTFDWETGYRYVYNPDTDTYDQVQLTLLDLLYPTEDDIGVVVVTQSLWHDLWTTWLKVMLQTFLGQGWLVMNDVLIHWGRKGAPAKSPDIAAIPGAGFPAGRNSYRVGVDGPLPAFVMEMTSEDSRLTDLYAKQLHYAAVGVKEYLIIDILPDDNGPWRLLGYRLEDHPFYYQLVPDAGAGLTFETIGLRFVAVERERIDVFDAKTGKQLLTPDALYAHAEAQTARAEAEATRAEAEAKARAEAEARIAELEARLQELENRSSKA